MGNKQHAVTPTDSSTTKGREPAAQAGSSVASEPSGARCNLALQTDNQGRAYYAVISERTGEVVYQIPPEQVRQVAEGIGEFLKEGEPKQSLDVKS